MTSLNTAEQRLVDLPDFEAPTIRQAPDGVDLFPITADGRLTVEILGGLLKNDRIIVSCIAEPGSHKDASYTSVSLLVTTDGRRAVNLPISIIAFSLGQTITFRYEVERGGEKKDSEPLILNVLPIPQERLPMPRALDAEDGGEGEVWDLTEGTHDRTIRLSTWPLIASGQLVELRVRGEQADGSDWWLVVLSWWGDKGDNAEPWGSAAYRDVQARFRDLKHFRNGSHVRLEFRVKFNQIQGPSKEVSFPVRTYTVMTNEQATPKIIALTDSKGTPILEGGTTTDSRVRVTATGEPEGEVVFFDGADRVGGGVFLPTGEWWGVLLKPFAPGEHSLKFVGDYGNKPESNVWRFTVVAPLKT
ncbi:hypothetical protein BK659_24590 [Pseudomonas brassicacearum]|uniref:Bacterial Ig-like domain-containing protein n=1 Tax=Pseudomonas brassicacearum TaxID=930166 RepID=A0A423GVS5_9PSED|nr:hypothetical protein [Pseudomonas brassicacearum]RON01692.1 hypothetical protein BK659_24590 [Pseudomonas brassicacearum]